MDLETRKNKFPKLTFEEIIEDHHNCLDEYTGVYRINPVSAFVKLIRRYTRVDYTKGWGVMDELLLYFSDQFRYLVRGERDDRVLH